MLQVINGGESDIDVLAGDFNEWRPLSYTMRALKKQFGAVPRHGTWPTGLPLLPLDSICVAPDTVCRTVRVANSAAARRASDHLPVVCDIQVPA